MHRIESELRRMQERYDGLTRNRGWWRPTPSPGVSAEGDATHRAAPDGDTGRAPAAPREPTVYLDLECWRAAARLMADARHGSELTTLQNLRILSARLRESADRSDMRRSLEAEFGRLGALWDRLERALTTEAAPGRPESAPGLLFRSE